ncbi:MAG: polysaccharide biosynthesis tyrosine autokinase [Rhizomicrobium sp.]
MNAERPVSAEEEQDADGRAERFGASGSEITLLDILRVIRVRRVLIVGTALTVIAATIAVLILMTPFYSATALVMLDQRKNTVEDAAAALTGLPSDPATLQNQVQILMSTELANRVIAKLHLEQDPEFRPRLSIWSYLNPFHWFPGNPNAQSDRRGRDEARTALANALHDGLTVEPVGLSTAIKVTYVSADPTKAAYIANAIADAYVEDQLEAKFDATQKATLWLTGRISELSRKAQEADSAVQRYKAEHNITTNATGASVVEQQTGDINSQLVISKTQLAEKEAAYSSLVALARAGRAADSAAAMASPVISALRAQESEIARQLADLSSKYLPGHPKILDLQAQKANIDSKIAEEVQRIVDAARNDVSVAAAHVGSLQSSLKQLEGEGATQNAAAVELTALQSAATSARSMYEAFLGRLNQTQGEEGIQTPDARVISTAQVPQSPSFPRKTLTLMVAIPAGLVLGLLLAFGRERLDSGFRTTSQLESMLGIPVLSTVPEIAGAVKSASESADFVLEHPISSFAEAIRGLQLGLALSNVDRRPKVILVTSSVPGEGKTTIALSLARIAARGGLKTVIIDADMRRPNVAKTLGKDHFTNGLAEAVTGEKPLDTCIVRDPKSEAFVLPCLQPHHSPADFLGSNAMKQLVKLLSTTFDLVVIDSAPILPVNDTKVLSQLVDSVLFVIRWEKTPREAATNALRALADVHAPISGVALARADSIRFRYYNYGYQSYYNYDKYYSA